MRISERGQITIPKRLRDQFGMSCGVEVEITPIDGGLLIRKRSDAAHPIDRVSGVLDSAENVEHPIDRVYGILSRVEHRGLPIDDVDEYIEEIRGR